MKQHHWCSLAAQVPTTRLSGLLLTVLLASCISLPPNLVSSEGLHVERVDSSKARIGSLYVGDSDGQLKIRGRLKKRYAGRSPIPGHLHIELLAHDGAVLEAEIVPYYRYNAKSGVSHFSRKFSTRPEDVHTLCVIHHVGENNGIMDEVASRNAEAKVHASPVCCPSNA